MESAGAPSDTTESTIASRISIAAWTRALEGESADLDRAAVERKIQDARGRLAR